MHSSNLMKKMQQVVTTYSLAGNIAHYCLTERDDFISTRLTATFPAYAAITTVRVPVMSDNIVEGDEMFSMSLNVPSLLGPDIKAGSVTSATGIILDSTSKKHIVK